MVKSTFVNRDDNKFKIKIQTSNSNQLPQLAILDHILVGLQTLDFGKQKCSLPFQYKMQCFPLNKVSICALLYRMSLWHNPLIRSCTELASLCAFVPMQSN